MSLQRHPPFSIISKPISLQNHSQRIAFILKFPILVPIPKVGGWGLGGGRGPARDGKVWFRVHETILFPTPADPEDPADPADPADSADPADQVSSATARDLPSTRAGGQDDGSY